MPQPSNKPDTTRETGWYPDLVYTGGKFESGLAFFADPLGRITRFSREPADLAAARRLPGQAAVPGLVDSHALPLHRLLRGRVSDGTSPVFDPGAHGAAATLTADDLYDTARMAFLEMLLSGTTCVGAFVASGREPLAGSVAGSSLPDQLVLRAARDVGIRIAFFKTACIQNPATPANGAFADATEYAREMDELRAWVARELPGDETWLGVGLHGVDSTLPASLKSLGVYAHAQRMRLHVRMGDGGALGTSTLRALAAEGLVDKRTTLIHARLGEDDVRLLESARAAVCLCPSTEAALRADHALEERLQRAGVSVPLGTDGGARLSLLGEARRLAAATGAPVDAKRAAALLEHATVAGARSLGAPSGALEVGRPADFFTVHLFDPSIAGAAADTLLAHIVLALERRAIREVWIGARQRISAGRHPQQGPIVGRFVEAQRRLWPGVP
ncbi:formimidoylglutamate deiminase [Opitutales bacterium ASA1]|uniref:amidohydrolase family protein n=1 Tax=Congregicoccus parvus TaxID=3081749 RepID=UPI002B2B75F7|nr:formimidoylglutamate deiminase [Opitutales bacterium ASA1]